MKTPADICSGIATRLDTIDGLKVYTTVPAKINELPAAIIVPETGEYDFEFGGAKMRHFMRVQVFVRLGDMAAAQDAIASFFDSVPAAINADPRLAGSVDSTRVTRYENYGLMAAPGASEPNALGVDFILEVIG